MKTQNFASFLQTLGYSLTLLSQNKDANLFSYKVSDGGKNLSNDQSLSVDYYSFDNVDDFFQTHLSVWNRNNQPSFVAVFPEKTLIIDARQKPDIENKLSTKIILKSFDYGVNTTGYNIQDKLSIISKEGVDTAYYFDFVIEHQQRRKATEVDKDLLLNLLALRNDLVTKRNEDTIHLLLLRCLFVKYLEDRGVFEENFLYNALNSQSPEKLISAFRKVRKINGDLFKFNEFRPEDLQQKYLKGLCLFFGYSDYRTKQGKFFPYQFDKIPIQLISNIYESFLREETKKGNGIYYTPSFLVSFMLANTLGNKLRKNPAATLLDPACGSGAFLVEAFRMLAKANNAEINYSRKVHIIQTQLFGIDIDPRALQIAAFSLYLALLEGEKPDFIREKIRTESPILPSLIGTTLLNVNALTDIAEFEVNNKKGEMTFDCILANPPWGSASAEDNTESVKIREAVGNKQIAGTINEYKSVSDFQRSQAFVLRTIKWSHENTVASMVVNNSIFLNENAKEFRTAFLSKYSLNQFYELTAINKIVFKKHNIGRVNNRTVEVGANEPCCVLVYTTKPSPQNIVSYISPNLNSYTENLRLIAYGERDTKEVKQDDLLAEDMLWRIFVNGNWTDYQIIKRRIINRDISISIECRSGFMPQKNMRQLGQPLYYKIIEPSDFSRYAFDPSTIGKFNWNQELHRRRDESIFDGKRIIIPVRPLVSDELRFRAIKLDQKFVHKDNILSIKIRKDGQYITDYAPYLAIINSKFLGYLFYHLSPQWGKGDAKRSTLRNFDIEALPLPPIDYSNPKLKRLNSLVSKVEQQKLKGDDVSVLECEIDELVYDLYSLTEYERAVVNEFYEVFYYRKKNTVTLADIKLYTSAFTKVFKLMLSDEADFQSSEMISGNLGAAACFKIQDKSNVGQVSQNLQSVLHIVKKLQTERSYLSYVLSEEKVKYYNKENSELYIVKSNQYKDWTIRQAIDDANEEVALLVNHLKANDK